MSGGSGWADLAHTGGMTNTKKGHRRAESAHGERLAVSVRGYDDGGQIEARAVGTLRNLGGFRPSVEVDYPLDLTPAEALHGLGLERAEQVEHEARLVGGVAAARVAGVSWQDIADALEIPKRTCMDRYSRHLGLM